MVSKIKWTRSQQLDKFLKNHLRLSSISTVTLHQLQYLNLLRSKVSVNQLNSKTISPQTNSQAYKPFSRKKVTKTSKNSMAFKKRAKLNKITKKCLMSSKSENLSKQKIFHWIKKVIQNKKTLLCMLRTYTTT